MSLPVRNVIGGESLMKSLPEPCFKRFQASVSSFHDCAFLIRGRTNAYDFLPHGDSRHYWYRNSVVPLRRFVFWLSLGWLGAPSRRAVLVCSARE